MMINIWLNNSLNQGCVSQWVQKVIIRMLLVQILVLAQCQFLHRLSDLAECQLFHRLSDLAFSIVHVSGKSICLICKTVSISKSAFPFCMNVIPRQLFIRGE